ncbi:hypothetical protein SDC9_20424 [bioreactor metagenome]|uniref:Uncharacterized protein n=1 Tax=bioreactor metagenome TaxID=1076179 RepID=A0A644U6Q4_9ZZZZ|nr:hypothetical protein [Methanocorpusculum sp.]
MNGNDKSKVIILPVDVSKGLEIINTELNNHNLNNAGSSEIVFSESGGILRLFLVYAIESKRHMTELTAESLRALLEPLAKWGVEFRTYHLPYCRKTARPGLTETWVKRVLYATPLDLPSLHVINSIEERGMSNDGKGKE